MKNYRRQRVIPRDELKALRAKDMTYKDIAIRYGLSISGVRYHVDDEYRERHIQESVKYRKVWRKDNKVKNNEWHREYMRERYHDDPKFRQRVIDAVVNSEKRKTAKCLAQGLCIECGKPNDSKTQTCSSCSEKINAYRRKRMKNVRRKRREQGLCPECGKPAKDYILCFSCRKYSRELAKKSRGSARRKIK